MLTPLPGTLPPSCRVALVILLLVVGLVLVQLVLLPQSFMEVFATITSVLYFMTRSSSGAESPRGVTVRVRRFFSTSPLLSRPVILPLGSLARVSSRRNLISCLGFALRSRLVSLPLFRGMILPPLSVFLPPELALLSPAGTTFSVLFFSLPASFVE